MAVNGMRKVVRRLRIQSPARDDVDWEDEFTEEAREELELDHYEGRPEEDLGDQVDWDDELPVLTMETDEPEWDDDVEWEEAPAFDEGTADLFKVLNQAIYTLANFDNRDFL